jgi:hypothetical protein
MILEFFVNNPDLSNHIVQAGLTAGAIAGIVKGAVAVGGLISAKVKQKKASGGASNVDPRQSAMLRLLKRQQRAKETGLTQDRKYAQQTGNRLLTSAFKVGNMRNVSPFLRMQTDLERDIMKNYATTQTQDTAAITKLNQDISDREMDLNELRKEKDELAATTTGQTAKKNFMNFIASNDSKKDDDEEGGGDGSTLGSLISGITKMKGGKGGN